MPDPLDPVEAQRVIEQALYEAEVDGLLRSAGRIDIAKRIAAALAALPAPVAEGVPEDRPRVCSHGIYHHGCPSCDRQDPEERL